MFKIAFIQEAERNVLYLEIDITFPGLYKYTLQARVASLPLKTCTSYGNYEMNKIGIHEAAILYIICA